jgi:hypothetical protein
VGENLASRRPKCARCSQPLNDGDLVTFTHGDLFHEHCQQVVTSQKLVRASKKLIKIANVALQKSDDRIRKRGGVK